MVVVRSGIVILIVILNEYDSLCLKIIVRLTFLALLVACFSFIGFDGDRLACVLFFFAFCVMRGSCLSYLALFLS